MRLYGVCALALAVCSPAFAEDPKRDPNQIGRRDVGKGINFYSLEREMALGRQLAEEVRRQARLIDDPIVSEFVNRLGQNLVRNSDARVPFTFQVIDGGALNAFALPGGFVFINSGLIEAAETEAELAGAIAHEIAHVAARHMTRQATRREIFRLATIPMAVLGGWAGVGARQAADIAIPMNFLYFSRSHEAEADLLGLQYAYRAGYDPAALIDLFERMLARERRNPGLLARVFSTHPLTADRILAAQKNIAGMLAARPEYVVTTSEFHEIRSRLKARYVRSSEDPARPRLRRATASGNGSDAKPVLKRRDLAE